MPELLDSTRQELRETIIAAEPVRKFLSLDLDEIIRMLVRFGGNLLVASIILFIGFWLARFVAKTIKRIMTRREADAGLMSFLSSGASLAIKVLVIITAVNQLGIQTTSFIAVLGAAGLAVGMALQGTLSNLAGGVLILSLKPFRVGEEIQVQGVTGVVRQILIFNTILTTGDNKEIIIPNSKISNENIINLTRLTTRRLETRVKLNYGEDVEKFKQIAIQIMNEDARIHQSPETPSVVLESLQDTALIFRLRAWTDTGDSSVVTFDIHRRIYDEVRKAGMSFPQTAIDVSVSNKA